SLQTRAFNWRPNHRTLSAPRRGSKEAIEMAYIFRGRLCGYICEECWEPISRVKVRLYRVREDQNTIARAVASPKDTFSILDEAQVREKESLLIAEADTDDAGNFSFSLGDDQKYGGEAFEVDVYCGTVPPHLPPRREQQ